VARRSRGSSRTVAEITAIRHAFFSQLPIADAACALNHVFEEYLVPIQFTPEQLDLHMRYNDVNASISPLLFDDEGGVVAGALLAIRDTRGWIGGFGVAPRDRGRGYGKTLIRYVLDVARKSGLKRISLEVLTENSAAIALYRSTGFTITRRLVSFEAVTERAPLSTNFSCVSPGDVLSIEDTAAPCWQRETASLRNGAASHALGDARGNYILFRHNDALAQVLKAHAVDARTLIDLAQALAMGHEFETILLLNEPEQSALAHCARDAGWSEPFVQYEMQLQL
jgi:ribosomal protein S18 acetylase RimI-like enzyme